jgi:hypothetical protein
MEDSSPVQPRPAATAVAAEGCFIRVLSIKRWVMESYRARAPKQVLKKLAAEQAWIAAAGLPR